jgi:hypothetical protein
MISYARMPGSSLAGLDMFNFSSYWNVLKGKIADIQALGPVISAHQQKLGVARYNLIQRGKPELAALLDDEIKKVQDDLNKWWKVKGYIDKYLPEWMKAASAPSAPVVNTMSPVVSRVSQPTVYSPPTMVDNVTGWVGSWFGGSGLSGVGALPIVLGVAAIAALAYCVNVGMALLQDYALKRSLTTDVIEKKITSGQAAEILSVPRESSIVSETISKTVEAVGSGIGFGIPTALLVGGGLYILYSTGIFKTLLGGNSQSSGS